MNNQETDYLQQYQQLSAMLNAGKINTRQFMAEVQKLRWQDEHGNWWMIDPKGTLLRYDGKRWLAVQPRQAASHQPDAPSTKPYIDTPLTNIKAQSPPQFSPSGVQTAAAAHSSPSSTRAVLPVLAILPSFLCGCLWFLYTFIGLFKQEGLRGVDFVTPMIVAGLPILFLVLKKPLDQLLLPLKPLIQSIPKAARLGFCLAVPIFLGCGCSTLSPAGYSALSISALISVITAGVLLRY